MSVLPEEDVVPATRTAFTCSSTNTSQCLILIESMPLPTIARPRYSLFPQVIPVSGSRGFVPCPCQSLVITCVVLRVHTKKTSAPSNLISPFQWCQTGSACLAHEKRPHVLVSVVVLQRTRRKTTRASSRPPNAAATSVCRAPDRLLQGLFHSCAVPRFGRGCISCFLNRGAAPIQEAFDFVFLVILRAWGITVFVPPPLSARLHSICLCFFLGKGARLCSSHLKFDSVTGTNVSVLRADALTTIYFTGGPLLNEVSSHTRTRMPFTHVFFVSSENTQERDWCKPN